MRTTRRIFDDVFICVPKLTIQSAVLPRCRSLDAFALLVNQIKKGYNDNETNVIIEKYCIIIVSETI